MIADRVLQCLDGVRQTGPDTWVARCPAHHDTSPSLSLRETDDRLLLHCFAGCYVSEIVGAIGLELDSLFPERARHSGMPERRRFPAADVLRAIVRELLIVVVAAITLANGRPLTDS